MKPMKSEFDEQFKFELPPAKTIKENGFSAPQNAVTAQGVHKEVDFDWETFLTTSSENTATNDNYTVGRSTIKRKLFFFRKFYGLDSFIS